MGMNFLTDLFSLEGKTAVVIGGTGVLCGEMAKGLAQAGATVIVVGRSEEKGAERLREIDEAGGRAHFVAADSTIRHTPAPDGVRPSGQ